MQQKRLFLGVLIDSDIIKNKIQKIKKEFDKATFGKWVELNNLHFTIKYLGDVDKEKIPQIKDSLKDLLLPEQSQLIVKGLSVLPKSGVPRILYAGIENKDKTLYKNSQLIDARLSELGFEWEARDFMPHITLLRLKSSTNDFKFLLKQYSQYEFDAIDSYKIELIESKLTLKGPVYKIL